MRWVSIHSYWGATQWAGARPGAMRSSILSVCQRWCLLILFHRLIGKTTAMISESRRSGPVAFSLLRQGWFRAIAGALDPAPLIGQGLRAAYNDSPVVTEALVDRYYELIMREGTRAAILGRTDSYSDTDTKTPDLSLLTQPNAGHLGSARLRDTCVGGGCIRDSATQCQDCNLR